AGEGASGRREAPCETAGRPHIPSPALNDEELQRPLELLVVLLLTIAATALFAAPNRYGFSDRVERHMQYEKRLSRGCSTRVSYTLGYIRGNTSATGTPSSSYQFLGDMNLDLNEGPGDNDRRHLLAW